VTEARYHVPRSQVWQGSRGGQQGKVHLHLLGAGFVSGRLTRAPGASLCGKRGWYERPAEPGEERCPTCAERAKRHGVEWPDESRDDG
jgi:hypothetical protein